MTTTNASTPTASGQAQKANLVQGAMATKEIAAAQPPTDNPGATKTEPSTPEVQKQQGGDGGGGGCGSIIKMIVVIVVAVVVSYVAPQLAPLAISAATQMMQQEAQKNAMKQQAQAQASARGVNVAEIKNEVAKETKKVSAAQDAREQKAATNQGAEKESSQAELEAKFIREHSQNWGSPAQEKLSGATDSTATEDESKDLESAAAKEAKERDSMTDQVASLLRREEGDGSIPSDQMLANIGLSTTQTRSLGA